MDFDKGVKVASREAKTIAGLNHGNVQPNRMDRNFSLNEAAITCPRERERKKWNVKKAKSFCPTVFADF